MIKQSVKTPLKRLVGTYIIFGIILMAVVLRLHILTHSAGFFCDEGAIILNIKSRSYFELLFPLDHAQCCPPLFLMLEKFIYSIFGLNEFFLRLVPSIASIMTLMFFTLIGFKVFRNQLSIIFGLLILSLNPAILMHSQSLKQYSTDTAIVLLIILGALQLKDRELSKKQSVLVGMILAFFCWFSYPAIFVSCPILFVFLLLAIRNNNHHRIKSLLYISFPLAISLVVEFFINCNGALHNQALIDYWSNNEKFFLQGVNDFEFFLEYIFGKLQSFTLIYLLLTIFGLLTWVRQDSKIVAIITAPIIFSSILGFFHLYPFGPTRVTLFVVPLVILIAAKTFDNFEMKSVLYLFLCFALFFFSVPPVSVINSISLVLKEKVFYRQSNVKEYVKLLKNEGVKLDDVIFVDINGAHTFEIYDEKNNFLQNNIIYQFTPENTMLKLNRIKKNQQVFFYLLHDKEVNPQLHEIVEPWIEHNCIILKEKNDEVGHFIKCRKRI